MEYIEFGKIVNTHALKGEIKVYSYTDNEEYILSLKQLYILNKCYEIEKSRFLKGMFTFKLKGIDSIEQAQSLVGNMVLREVLQSEKANSEEFFVKDLVGIKVYTLDNKYLGELVEVFNTGANDVYSIALGDKTIYLPAIKRVIKSIDINSGKMLVDNLEGLI